MKWMYFHLYVIMDIFSRYVVGWMVAEQESAELAKRLINETCSKQGIVSGQLTLHADRGTSMKSKPLAMLLSDLGVTKTHSRPHVSNDNPYSESQFKTLKYRPEFPKRGDVLRSLSKKKMYGSPNSNPSPELGADKENHTSWERYYQVSDCSSSLRNDWYSGI